MAAITYAEVSWERMSNAIEKVRQRLLRAAGALAQGQIPYAVAGGNAVAAWVSRVDEAAVRNTQDVDIILRRAGPERFKFWHIRLPGVGPFHQETSGFGWFRLLKQGAKSPGRSA